MTGGSKSKLAKAAGAEPAGQMRDEKLHAVVARVKKLKTLHVRSTFRSCDVEKVHRCGAKHISKSKCTKHLMFGPLLEVGMSKKCTPFGAKHISKSKCTKHIKTLMFGPFLEVEMSKKCAPLWRERSKNARTPNEVNM